VAFLRFRIEYVDEFFLFAGDLAELIGQVNNVLGDIKDLILLSKQLIGD
jgi:hypothetical protein